MESINCKGAGKLFYIQKDALDEKEGITEKNVLLAGLKKYVVVFKYGHCGCLTSKQS